MKITCLAEQTMPCAAQAAFELIVDANRFPSMFPGYGPIPAIRAVTMDRPPAVGVTRRIHNADGSILIERITALDRPTRHAYTLGGFRAPFSWLIRLGEAEWSVSERDSGSQVRWEYRFTAASALAYPVAIAVLQTFMTRAMQRCLGNMARTLADTESSPMEPA